jgi:hypothetical protein
MPPGQKNEGSFFGSRKAYPNSPHALIFLAGSSEQGSSIQEHVSYIEIEDVLALPYEHKSKKGTDHFSMRNHFGHYQHVYDWGRRVIIIFC